MMIFPLPISSRTSSLTFPLIIMLFMYLFQKETEKRKPQKWKLKQINKRLIRQNPNQTKSTNQNKQTKDKHTNNQNDTKSPQNQPPKTMELANCIYLTEAVP